MSREEMQITAVREQRRRADREGSKPASSGPVIGCVEEGAEGLATARIAGSLARSLGANLLLATVEQACSRTPTGEDLTLAAARHGRLLLDRAARRLDQSAALRVTVGEPAETLLALAAREGAALLVVPATARSRVRPLLLGSVYLALAGAASCPVVVVPPGVDAIAHSGPIICGVDGSPPALDAACTAADLAERLEEPLLLVHAAKRHDEGLTTLQAVADLLPRAVPKLLLVEHGPAAERVARVARSRSARLLVAGSRGRGQDASALLGSVASGLATTVDRPLVIVPPGAHPPGRGGDRVESAGK